MDKETAIKLFEDKRVRVLWDEDLEKWFFSIIDVVGVLSESDNPRKYWSVLKTRLKAEGSQLATNCSQLKMKAEDGKMRLTKCDWGQTYTFDIGCRLKIPEITKEPSCFRSVESLSKDRKMLLPGKKKQGPMEEIGPCRYKRKPMGSDCFL